MVLVFGIFNNQCSRFPVFFAAPLLRVFLLFKIRILIGTFRCDITVWYFINAIWKWVFASQRHLEIGATCNFKWKGFWRCAAAKKMEKDTQKEIGGEKNVENDKIKRLSREKRKNKRKNAEKLVKSFAIVIISFIMKFWCLSSSRVFNVYLNVHHLIIDNRAQKNFSFLFVKPIKQQKERKKTHIKLLQ